MAEGRYLRVPWPVVLASGSPRRQDLLRELFDSFEVLTADIDEDFYTVEDPIKTACTLALLKAKAVAAIRPGAFVIGGDTVVFFKEGGQIIQLAKPNDFKDACRMLALLSGRTHIVATGVALVWPGGESCFHEESAVRFRTLGEDEIRDYVATGEPMDKAGAYAVQAGGGSFIESIQGSRSNVIGLPLERLRVVIEELELSS